jgi:hypothetical protein
LLNVEEDDAGRLRKFRERFGRGFDAEAKEVVVDDEVRFFALSLSCHTVFGGSWGDGRGGGGGWH